MRKLAGVMILGFALAAVPSFGAVARAAASPRVVATYFHRTIRCQTCLQIESLARYDVTDVMVSDIESGQLSWRTLNFEDEGNTHFEKEFGLDGPSLVITLEDGDTVLKWARLDRVWEIYSDVDAFDKYVLGAVEEYLEEASEFAVKKSKSQ
ncbi:MAG: hypothetical protein IPO18_11515 [bacterium]|nr:hypothetical protein [bacterium]